PPASPPAPPRLRRQSASRPGPGPALSAQAGARWFAIAQRGHAVLLDVSAVTDGLLGLVSQAWSSAPVVPALGASPMFTPTFTGLAPDAVRSGGGPQLSLFLYHVESDNTQQASFWEPQMQSDTGPPVSYLPLALNMFYLLSAYSEGNYAQEQQAM